MDWIIDLGNTRLHLAAFKNGELQASRALPHGRGRDWSSFEQKWRQLLAEDPSFAPERLERLAIASVQPAVLEKLRPRLEELPVPELLVLGQNCPIDLENRSLAPDQVGHDRLLHALWLARSGRRRPGLVVSMGTAITFDLVAADGAFLGGAIRAGYACSARGLSHDAAQLPLVTVDQAPKVLGQDTHGALASGLFWGTVGAIDGLCQRFREDHGVQHIVATGGDAALLAPHCREVDELVEHVALRGAWFALPPRSRDA